MWIWVGPRWMRPGSRFARVMWFVSLPIAAGMIWFAWGPMTPRHPGSGTAFLWVWTVGLIAIEALNFRIMYLGRGRRAARIQAAYDKQDADRGA